MGRRKNGKKNTDFLQTINSDFIKFVKFEDFRHHILPNAAISVSDTNFFDIINMESFQDFFSETLKDLGNEDKLTPEKDECEAQT